MPKIESLDNAGKELIRSADVFTGIGKRLGPQQGGRRATSIEGVYAMLEDLGGYLSVAGEELRKAGSQLRNAAAELENLDEP